MERFHVQTHKQKTTTLVRINPVASNKSCRPLRLSSGLWEQECEGAVPLCQSPGSGRGGPRYSFQCNDRCQIESHLS